MKFLGGNCRKSLRQVKPHLVAEHAERACAGAILFFNTGGKYVV